MPQPVILSEAEYGRLVDALSSCLDFLPEDANRRRIPELPLRELDRFVATFAEEHGVELPLSPQIQVHAEQVVREALRQAANRSEHLDLFVLDTLANDIEAFLDVLRLANHPDAGWQDYLGRALEKAEIEDSLRRLVRSGLVEAGADLGSGLTGLGLYQMPEVSPEETLYLMTNAGRERHEAWKRGEVDTSGSPGKGA